MAIYIATGTSAPGLTVAVSGTTYDISDHVHSVTVTENFDDVDLTAMGAVSHQHGAGLRDDRIEAEVFQDFASAKIDAMAVAVMAANALGTGATVVAYANGTTATATAPKYTMIAQLLTYTPIALGAPGDASMTQLQFVPAQGATTYIVRGTS